VLGKFFMIYCIGGSCVIVGSNLHESFTHCSCQIVEGLNHSHAHGHLCVVGSLIIDFEVFILFYKSILNLCSFLLQHYTCDIDLINKFH
jgi:hypothetical protein